MAGNYTRRQVVTGQNGATATTSVTATLTATQSGNLLIAFVMFTNTGVISAPAGWTRLGNQLNTNPAGGSAVAFVLNNCAAGITSVQFNTTIAGLGCVIICEESGGNIPYLTNPSDVYSGFANTNATSWGVGNKSFQATNECVLGACGYINNAALVVSNIPSGYTQIASVITTAASGNANLVLLAADNIGAASTNFGGLLLSAIPTNGPDTMFVSFLVDPLLASNGFVGPYPMEG